jgi:predicted nucleic acid-binding Zn ribbon protein
MPYAAGRGPRAVGELLVAAVPGLAERLLERRIAADWDATVGSAMARRTRPGALRDGQLEVRADNSPWLHELTLRAEELLATLQRRHGSGVRSVRLGLGQPAGPRAGGPAQGSLEGDL